MMSDDIDLGHDILKLWVSTSVAQLVRKWLVSIISITQWVQWVPPTTSQLGLVWRDANSANDSNFYNWEVKNGQTSNLRFNQMLHSQLFYVRADETTENTAQFHESRLIWTTHSFSHLVLLCSLNGWQWSTAVSAQLALWQRAGRSLLGQCGKRMMSCCWT